MSFNYTKNLLCFLLLFIIMFNYLEIKIFNIRENNENIKVNVECPEYIGDDENLCHNYAAVKFGVESFKFKK